MGVRDDEKKAASLVRINDSGVFPGQKYQHWSTKDIYIVVAVGLFEPNLEPMVHYRVESDPYAVVWTRELDVFCGHTIDPASPASGPVKRFERVS